MNREETATGRPGTHWEGCEEEHPLCLLRAERDEWKARVAELEQQRDYSYRIQGEYAAALGLLRSMRVTLLDKRIAHHVTPNQIRNYLNGQGWERKENDSALAEIWMRDASDPEAPRDCLLVPLMPDDEGWKWDLYARRTVDLINDLGEVEGRSAIAVLLDLRAASKETT